MDYREVFLVDLDAHLQPHVFFVIDVPRARMTDHFAIRGLGKHRSFPEARGQRFEAERSEKSFAEANHLLRIRVATLQRGGQIVPAIGRGRREQRIDVAPGLRPHVSEQVRGNRFIFRDDLRAVLFSELAARVGVERVVQRLHLLPQPLHLGRERVRFHVVLGSPHRARVFETHLFRAFVAELNEAHVVFANRDRYLMPTEPRPLQLLGIAAVAHDLFKLRQAEAFSFVAFRAVFAFAVVAFHRSGDLREFGAFCRILRRRQSEREFQQFELSLQFR